MRSVTLGAVGLHVNPAVWGSVHEETMLRHLIPLRRTQSSAAAGAGRQFFIVAIGVHWTVPLATSPVSVPVGVIATGCV